MSQPSPTPAAKAGPLPALLTEIPLAPAGARLTDLLLDSDDGRLYVTDTAGQLHILDAASYGELATLPAAGDLTLDEPNNRLYVSPRYEEGIVTVVDTAAQAVVSPSAQDQEGTVSPGGFVAVDSARRRFYVGNLVVATMPEAAGSQQPVGVRVYDAATLNELGQVVQPGIPVYNPLRDELYIVAYTVHSVDPESLQVTGDLLPEITAQVPAWCNGCLAATNAHVYPDRNLLVVEVTNLSAGKGPGMLPPPRFFDATTLEELTDLANVPPVERGCEDRLILAEPVGGRVYRGERYSRYVSHNNLLVYDLDGNLATWRDGLSLGITNPNTGQMYVPHGDDTLVLDLEALSPVGTLPPVCIHTLDASTGRIYALGERDLVVFSEEGGWPEPLPPSEAGPLPDEQILSIHPSPDYAHDRTLFVSTGDKLYRSIDGGQRWAQLRGGLPGGPYLRLDLSISPDFAANRTLFAGGYRSDFWGEVVYRSTDSGDHWQPMWQDLTHLRVYDVAISPSYATDSTLLAYSRYQRLTPWKGGFSVFHSSDGGLSWALVMTQTQEPDLPPPEEFLPPDPSPPSVQFRVIDYGRRVERSINRGVMWEPVVVTRQPEFNVQATLVSPTFAADRTVYVLSEFDLFRSTDGGDTWARWLDERLVGRDYTTKLSSAAVSPPLGDGSHHLFVGTVSGEFWTLAPAALDWEPVRVAQPWPVVLAGEWVGEIEADSNGGVWLGTWGGGLARYTDGEIDSRYTVTDGLSSQYIGGIAVASDGSLWAGGDLPSGIARFDGQSWTVHPFVEEDAVGGVLDVEVAPDGVVWAGAQAPGLLRWTGTDWQLIADPEGLTGWRIQDIDIAADGTLWCATARGLVYYHDGRWVGQGDGETLAVELGAGGTAHLLSSGASVWRYAAGQWTELPRPQEKRFLSALALHVAADGAVWLGTHEGAFRYDGQAWRQFTAQDGLPDNNVAAVAEDAGGWLWFGTEKGAARVDPTTLDLSPVVWPELPTQPTPAAPTPTARIGPTPTPCAFSPAVALAALYAEGQVASQLRCALAEAAVTPAAFQPFERGLMFWRADEGTIYVLESGGTWASYVDTWDESQPPYDPALTPPDGLQQPVRGFGNVWREHLGGPGASIGWGLAEERPYELLVQRFSGGQMLVGPEGEQYALYSDGKWHSRGQP